MSCSCFCCVTASGELLHGIRKKEPLVSPEEEEEKEEEEAYRSSMDLSLLREKYLSSMEQQKHSQVILYRTVSEELSEAVSFVPVTQGLSPPPVTSDPDPTSTCDPWHVHLELHRRGRPRVTAASTPETTNTNSSSRRSSASSCESNNRKLSSDSCCCTNEEEPKCRGEEEEMESCPPPTASSSSISSTSCSLTEDQGPRVLQRRLSAPAPALRFTRQYSVGGVGSSTGGQHPFPSRKTPRISEAARRLGLYASF
ncbi:hypothetical protein PBY51_013866 [Eleginops maclovinus]|uniref:Uncharacterized protein n=1 Tax=Eleginops maclovinus TaxID=56733 RepID=A0AAN8A3B2_ELEMC|nr:hypothetical protein PBY51_013866 [Eleginops maclovinus]